MLGLTHSVADPCVVQHGHAARRRVDNDIATVLRVLGLRESVFIDTYLQVDEEGDFVVKSSPCPFLGSDNRCSIYEDRPSDCRRFPYTDEDVLLKRPTPTLKNSSFCPITFFVLEQLRQKLDR